MDFYRPNNLTDLQRLNFLVAEASRLRQVEGPARSPDVIELEAEIDALRQRIHGPRIAALARHYENLTRAAQTVVPRTPEAA